MLYDISISIDSLRDAGNHDHAGLSEPEAEYNMVIGNEDTETSVRLFAAI